MERGYGAVPAMFPAPTPLHRSLTREFAVTLRNRVLRDHVAQGPGLLVLSIPVDESKHCELEYLPVRRLVPSQLMARGLPEEAALSAIYVAQCYDPSINVPLLITEVGPGGRTQFSLSFLELGMRVMGSFDVEGSNYSREAPSINA